MLCVVAPAMALLRQFFGERRTSKGAQLATICALLGAQAASATVAPSPDSAASQMHRRFASVIQRTIARGSRLRVIAAGTPFTVSPEALAVMLLRQGSTPLLQPWETRVPGAHRSVSGSAQLPTLALVSGPAVEELSERPGARLLEIHDPVPVSSRVEARALRDSLIGQLSATHHEDLIVALKDGQTWLTLRPMPGVDSAQLQRYLNLVGGDDKRAYALFLSPTGPW
jgi:hypothetical protein